MHWRKPFPPRTLRPSPFAELADLLLASLRPATAQEPEPTAIAPEQDAAQAELPVPAVPNS